jgi:hypothetical protein
LAGLVWLAGAMKSVPGLEAAELAVCLPLPVLGILFGSASVWLARVATPRQPASRWIIAAITVSSLIVLILVSTYFDMDRQR